MFKQAGTKTQVQHCIPPSNGQIEVVNRCLETYLRCFSGENPKQWPNWLSWMEYSFNTTYPSSAKISPFQILYGHTTPGDTFPSKIEGVIRLKMERDNMLQQLKQNLDHVQQRMKCYTDKKRRELEFSVGDRVYLKVQPYRLKPLAR